MDKGIKGAEEGSGRTGSAGSANENLTGVSHGRPHLQTRWTVKAAPRLEVRLRMYAGLRPNPVIPATLMARCPKSMVKGNPGGWATPGSQAARDKAPASTIPTDSGVLRM